jgi:hypothetical protein
MVTCCLITYQMAGLKRSQKRELPATAALIFALIHLNTSPFVWLSGALISKIEILLHEIVLPNFGSQDDKMGHNNWDSSDFVCNVVDETLS